jgi:peroxiredoxin
MMKPTPVISRRLLLLAAAGAPFASSSAAAAAKAPDFTLRTLEGRNLRLAEQRGSVVMVNFWASWCAPCRVEMPHLSRIWDKYRDAGYVFLTVNVDENLQNAAGAASRMALRAPVLLDTDKKVVRAFEVATMPTTVLIDRDGLVRHVHRGYREGVEQTYEQQVRALLKE